MHVVQGKNIILPPPTRECPKNLSFYLKSEGEVEHRYSDKISKANCVIPLAPYLTIILDAWITKKKQKLKVF